MYTIFKNNTYKDKPLRAFYYRSKSKTDAACFRDKCLKEGFSEPLFVTVSILVLIEFIFNRTSIKK